MNTGPAGRRMVAKESKVLKTYIEIMVTTRFIQNVRLTYSTSMVARPMVGCSLLRITVGDTVVWAPTPLILLSSVTEGTQPKRRVSPLRVCVHPGRSYLSFRVHDVLRLTLVSAIEWKAGCISIFSILSLPTYFSLLASHHRRHDIDIFALCYYSNRKWNFFQVLS